MSETDNLSSLKFCFRSRTDNLSNKLSTSLFPGSFIGWGDERSWRQG